jgi:iron complex transport system ATP-binding protein
MNAKTLLSDINFNFNISDIVAIIGNNGTGKTTLLKTIARIYQASKNKIFIDERDLNQLSTQYLAQNIVYLSQHPPHFSNILVEARIAHGLIPFRGINSLLDEKTFKKIKKIAEKLNISHLLGRNLMQLSGGEKQLVHIAKAFINQQAKIYLLDEPSTYLDIEQKQNLIKIIRAMGEEKKLVLFSSHDVFVINEASNKKFILKNNRNKFNN